MELPKTGSVLLTFRIRKSCLDRGSKGGLQLSESLSDAPQLTAEYRVESGSTTRLRGPSESPLAHGNQRVAVLRLPSAAEHSPCL